jgi:superfamily I DNA/RNA helicase
LILFDRESGFENLCDILRTTDAENRIQGFVKPYGNNQADKDRYIFREGHITISTTKGAKGYDAPVVFLVGANNIEIDEKGRASFYVGATRAKLVLYVTGVQGNGNLLREATILNKIL